MMNKYYKRQKNLVGQQGSTIFIKRDKENFSQVNYTTLDEFFQCETLVNRRFLPLVIGINVRCIEE